VVRIDQIGKKSERSVEEGRQCVSLSSFLPPAAQLKPDTVNGSPVSVVLSTQVATGQYLVGHEIIALHLAVTLGGAEFHPSHTQIRIGGSQTGTPNQTVLFPGAYNDNDPGIYVPKVYSSGAAYTFLGPPVSNLASPADMSGQLSPSGASGGPSGNSSPWPDTRSSRPT
jgi:hypothetical protein